MITLKNFLELIEYKIIRGNAYLWTCYGPNVRSLEYENNKPGDEQVNFLIVFDTVNQTVYEMQAWDGPNKREYRWIHPQYLKAYKQNAKDRNVSWNQSLDDRSFIELEVEDDMLEKAEAMYSGSSYDERIQIQLGLSEEDENTLMRLAHEADMSLNQFVDQILREKMDRMKGK